MCYFASLLITARKRSLGQGNIFRSVCQEFCPRGWCAWSWEGVPGPGGGGAGPGGGLVETPPRTATAASGTHPTGMHSCLQTILIYMNGKILQLLTLHDFVPVLL